MDQEGFLHFADEEPEKPLRETAHLAPYNNDILECLLVYHGQDPFNALLVESGHKNREDSARTPEAVKGRYQFLNRNLWEDAVGIIPKDEDQEEDEEMEEWPEAESDGELQAPPDGGVIFLYELSIDA